MHLKLLLVPHFSSCSTPGDRRQCQSFAITVPVDVTEDYASLSLYRSCFQQDPHKSWLRPDQGSQFPKQWFKLILVSQLKHTVQKSPVHLKFTWDSCLNLENSPATANLPWYIIQMAPAGACKNQKHSRMAQMARVEIVPQCRKQDSWERKRRGRNERAVSVMLQL